MMRPKPRSAIPGEMAWVTLNRLVRLVEITASHMPRSILGKNLSRVMPAQFTSTVMGPSASVTVAAMRTQAASSVTSASALKKLKPRSFCSFSHCGAGGKSGRQLAATR